MVLICVLAVSYSASSRPATSGEGQWALRQTLHPSGCTQQARAPGGRKDEAEGAASAVDAINGDSTDCSRQWLDRTVLESDGGAVASAAEQYIPRRQAAEVMEEEEEDEEGAEEAEEEGEEEEEEADEEEEPAAAARPQRKEALEEDTEGSAKPAKSSGALLHASGWHEEDDGHERGSLNEEPPEEDPADAVPPWFRQAGAPAASARPKMKLDENSHGGMRHLARRQRGQGQTTAEGTWLGLHRRFVKEAYEVDRTGTWDVVFYGDSIIEEWRCVGPTIKPEHTSAWVHACMGEQPSHCHPQLTFARAADC